MAGAADHSLREWHGEDGLPNELVQGVAADNQGYLWVIADVSGISRFDGLRFDLPRGVAESNSTMVARSMVRHPKLGLLFSSTAGQIWIWDGSVLRRDPVTDLFSNQPIQNWLVQEDGTLWAASVDGKIEYLRNGRVTEVKLEGVKTARQTVTMATDGSGAVWIAVGSALFRWNGSATVRITPPWRESELRIASSRGGPLWVMTRDQVGRWTGGGLESAVNLPEQMGAHYVRAVLEDREGNLWVGTRSQGAYMVSGSGYETVPTSYRTVSSFFQDDEDNMWLGTAGGGLNRLQTRRFRLFDSNAGLLDDMTFSVCEDSNGRIWFANRDGGVVRMTNKEIEVMSRRSQWPATNASRVAADPGGGVWFGGGGGLYKAGGDDSVQKLNTQGFLSNRAMYVSSAGELWLAGDEAGVARINQAGVAVFDSASGLQAQTINCFAEDAGARLLVGTAGGMLLRFDGSRFDSARPEGARPLASVSTLCVEKGGTIWGATATGLLAISNNEERFLTPVNGLPDGLISQILVDDLGAIWLGCHNGIFRAERREIMEFLGRRTNFVRFTNFGKNEGFARISCVGGFQPNCLKSREGTLWFTTRLGVLAIDPNIVRKRNRHLIYIDGFRINDVVQATAGEKRVRSDMHKMEVHFSVLNYTAPERTPVRYRLDGFDQEWIDAGLERKAMYPKLPPGRYKFRVASADDNGEWYEADAPLSIIVVPYWWQTIWFQIGAAAFAIIVLIVGIRARSQKRFRNKLQLIERESAVHRERTRIARDIHDELGASLTRISLLTQTAPSVGTMELVRKYFDEIYVTTTEITRSIDEIVWAVDARHDNLESLVSYLDSYAQSFLSVAKIRYRLVAPPVCPEITLDSHVRHQLFLAFKESLNNCVKHSKATEVLVVIEASEGALSLAVSDDGLGLEKGTITRFGGGKGFKNLTARMAAIGGSFQTKTSSQGGTEILFRLPLPKVIV